MKHAWKLIATGTISVSLTSGLAASSIAVSESASPSGLSFSLSQSAGLHLASRGTTDFAVSADAPQPDLIEQGRSHYLSGQYAAAAETWQQAAVTAAANGDSLSQAVALSYASLAYQELNQWAQAEAAIEQSFAVVEAIADEGISPALQAQMLNTRAGLAYHLGQAETALAMWEQAETHYQQADDRSGQLGSQINQAQALQSLGFYRRSRQQLEAIAQSLAEMPDSELKVNGLRTLGNALQVLGDLTASRAALFESANIAIAIDSINELSATYLSLGRTARDWGDTNAAMAMFERAKQSALNPADALQADLSQLRFYVNQGDTENTARTAADLVQQLESLPPSRLSVICIRHSQYECQPGKGSADWPVAAD